MRRIALLLLVSGLGSCHTDFRSGVGDALANLPEPIRTVPIEAFDRDGSAIAVGRVAGRTVAFIADEDEGALHTIDLDQRVELARTELEGRPTAALVLPSGELAVALRDAGSVAVLAVTDIHESLLQTASIETADEPVALATSPDARTLWVASGVGRALEGFSIGEHVRRAAIALGREPRAVTISSDGARAFVGYMSDGGVGVVDLMSRRAAPPAIAFVGFGPARVARQTFALVRMPGLDEQILAPTQMVNPGEPLVISDGYGSSESSPVAFDLARVDGRSGLGTSLAFGRGVESDCRLPRGAALDPARKELAVACLGSNAVAFYDANNPSPASLLKARVMIADGPSAVAFDPVHERFVVLSAFARRVHVMTSKKAAVPIALSHAPGKGLSIEAAEGRKLFYSADDDRISADGRACASCHPDGRDDGLVWSTPKGPRQTVLLAGRLARPAPYGWDGKHESLGAHMKVTMQNLRGFGLPDKAIGKLAAYLVTLPPPPKKEKPLTPEQAKGRDLFASAKSGCAGCHADSFEAHDVASATKTDKNKTFLAPSLRFIAASAPYFHDGRYPTLGSMLRAKDSSMTAPELGESDLDALEAYLTTL